MQLNIFRFKMFNDMNNRIVFKVIVFSKYTIVKYWNQFALRLQTFVDGVLHNVENSFIY